MIYTQCILQKGSVQQTSFIPSKFARIGKCIKLKNEDGWDNGWIVAEIGQTISEKDVPNSHKAIKDHRKRTGDSF